MRTKILPYVANSMAARKLAEALDVPVMRQTDGPHTLRHDDFVINWGKSGTDQIGQHQRVMNKPTVLRSITNKLRTFQRIDEMDSIMTVPWTDDPHVVGRWLGEGRTVMARTKLTGHSGAGIVILKPDDDDFVNAQLYTQYIPNCTEYRVHFIRTGDRVVYKTQQKVLDGDRDTKLAPEIQNHKNGYVYNINRVQWFTENNWLNLKAEIGRVFHDLDFGAVDVMVDPDGKMYILEVNTAPGLKSPTLIKFYTQAMTSRIAWEEGRE